MSYITFFKELGAIFIDTKIWSIENILLAISLVIIMVGGCFAYFQWRSANKIRRAEFLNQIIEKLRFDESIVKSMLRIEYNNSWYNESFHYGDSDLEYEMDKVLSYLSYICYLRKIGNIRRREFKILKYELERTCSSIAVRNYFWNLYHFSKKVGTECTFQYLIDYGIKSKLIDRESFFDSESKRYPKYLNF